jgi:SAM-dependent methyltransferase
MGTEGDVAKHYRHGALERAVFDALTAAGKDIARLEVADLTDEFVAVATALTQRCGLSDRVSFRQGSALALPFDAATFDAAILIHVGMNISDKRRLFGEARRVLKPSARFGVYDILRIGKGRICYPTPWAAREETSFVEDIGTYRDLLSESGFRVEAESSRADDALALWQAMREARATHGPPVLGLHILMGSEAPLRLANVIGALEGGVIAPTQILARTR